MCAAEERDAAFDFGLWYTFRNPLPWQRPSDEVYDGLLEHIVAMEAAGYDTIWLSEHHFSEDGYLPALAVMTAAIAVRTSRVWIGHSVIEAPFYHPVQLAESIAVCDILSHGRVRLGIGLGRVDHGRPSFDDEGDAFGVPNSAGGRASIFEEQVEIIKKCWAPGPFRHTGRHFQLPEINVTPKPLQPGGPGLWFGVSAERAIQRAARMGDGYTGSLPGVARYRELVRENGRDAEAGRAVVIGLPMAARDPEAAEARYGPHLDYIGDWYGLAPEVRDMIRGRFVEPHVVATQIAGARALGATGAMWWAPFAGASPQEAIPFFTEMIEDVRALVDPAS
jgi:alkanesulfonate monooxygenase SsuD/methylene tetrahydromethanopterin reductase-like flavin-dependent oxidoreductase (luciferase family)